VRKARPDDIPALLDLAVARDGKAAKDRLIRLSMIGVGIETPYVAVTGDGIPCHMQWMIGSGENRALQQFSRGGLPAIGEDEVILENAFTLEPYRRQGIEIETVRVLFDIARQQGVQRAILFVGSNSTVSLKLVSELGFTPYCLKTCRRRMLRQYFTFARIPPETAKC
jgi:GNAT superfamily N-acetyltransferase